jgi:hypothetical protein
MRAIYACVDLHHCFQGSGGIMPGFFNLFCPEYAAHAAKDVDCLSYLFKNSDKGHLKKNTEVILVCSESVDNLTSPFYFASATLDYDVVRVHSPSCL